jgi:hypothetical protein
MSKEKNPKEKKRLSLERDHRMLIADSNSRQRATAVRIAKKSSHHSIRRKERALLQTGINNNPEDIQDKLLISVPPKARGIWKTSAVSLGQFLDPDIRSTQHSLRSVSPIKKEKRVPLKKTRPK